MFEISVISGASEFRCQVLAAEHDDRTVVEQALDLGEGRIAHRCGRVDAEKFAADRPVAGAKLEFSHGSTPIG
jgi:hypothetical protein